MSSNRLVLTAIRDATRTTQLPRTSQARWGKRAIRFVAYIVGLAIFAVLVAVIVTRVLVATAVQGVRAMPHQVRPALRATVSLRTWASLPPTVVAWLITLCTLSLWCISLQWVDVRAMNDLGMISVLPPSSLIALAGLTLGFCLILSNVEDIHSSVLLVFLFALIFMLYATPALVEEAPRFTVTYWLAGHTEYILRTGSVNPFLDAYFNWPGFFILTGLLTKLTGVSSVMTFAPWASFVYNLLYLAPMYVIFSAFTRDRRTIWLGLWFFYITDWVWQDYFDPQGLNVFFYLVIIAILLKGFGTAKALQEGGEGPIATIRHTLSSAWAHVKAIRLFRSRAERRSFAGYVSRFRAWMAISDNADETPEQHRKRIALLCVVIIVFALSVVSHPITPFFILLSVTALVLFGRVTPRWLPFLMAAMIAGWDFTAASPYLAGHLRSDLAAFGNFQIVASTNVTNRLVAGSSAHQFISHVRILATAAIWGLAALGAILRWRSSAKWANGATWGKGSLFSHDLAFLLLVIAPGFLVIAQPYGGEMAMRYYLFTLPFVSFFAAAAFRTRVTLKRNPSKALPRWVASKAEPLAATAIILSCILLLGGFMFARYGNESADYYTYDESNAVSYLYQVAPPHSLLLQGWTGTPWRYEDLEMYNYSQLYTGSGQAAAFEAHNISGILNTASNTKYPSVYVIFSRSQRAQAQLFGGVPPSAFTQLEDTLLASGKFKLIYKNADADILIYVHPQHATKSTSAALR